MFFAIATLVWLGGHAALARFHAKNLPPKWRRGTYVAVAALALLPLVTMAGSRAGLSLGVFGSWVGFVAMGLSSQLLVFTLVAKIIGTISGRITRDPEGREPEPDPARRFFLRDVANLGVVGGAAALTGAGAVIAGRVPAVVRVSVPVDDLPAALDGFSIVQLTDVHVGPTIRGEWLERVVAEANSLGADMACVTGDLVDGSVDALRDEIRHIGDLRAPHGTYFVTGNHEYYSGAEAWCEHLQSLGLDVLLNEHRDIEVEGARLVVGGVTDVRAGVRIPGHASDPIGTFERTGPADVKVLLAHQPRSVFDAAKAGWDVMLSGHTHGGQYFPMSLFIHLFQPYVAGLHLHENTWLYVSRGTGYWGPPNRLGSAPEITLITLRNADALERESA